MNGLATLLLGILVVIMCMGIIITMTTASVMLASMLFPHINFIEEFLVVLTAFVLSVYGLTKYAQYVIQLREAGGEQTK